MGGSFRLQEERAPLKIVLMKKINKILFITLSNIGDVILTLPALDILRREFPEAKITVMSGPRPKEVFEGNPAADKFMVFDKHASLMENIKLFNDLRKERFDMVIDFRNSFLGAILPVKYKAWPFQIIPKSITHMKQRNLYGLQRVIRGGRKLLADAGKVSLRIGKQDREYIEGVLRDYGVTENDLLIVFAAGARSHIKRWGQDKFSRLAERFLEDKDIKIILVGDEMDKETAEYINNGCGGKTLNLCGKTTLAQLAALLTKAGLLITNDSATMHIGSYLDIPVLAVFGPTNELKYGPWSRVSSAVKKDIPCRPCEKAQCRFGHLDCMRLVTVEEVFKEAKNILYPAGVKNLK